MKSAPEILSDVPEVSEYKSYITELYQRANYVPYTGVVYNIFFHSLALYPDIAFSSSRGQELFNIMTTRYEFKKTLENYMSTVLSLLMLLIYMKSILKTEKIT